MRLYTKNHTLPALELEKHFVKETHAIHMGMDKLC